VQQVAPPDELYRAPANLFVAQFIGEPKMNVVSGKTLGREGSDRIGLRAEHIEVGLGTPPTDAIAARVSLVEPLGRESWVWLDAGEPIVARAQADFSARPGDAAWF